jgi:hypothetical protein
MEGYEEPEWNECFYCYHSWDDLADHGMGWFVGRTSFCRCVAGKILKWWGYGGFMTPRLRDAVKCRLGIHRWHEPFDDHDIVVCAICWKDKTGRLERVE